MEINSSNSSSSTITIHHPSTPPTIEHRPPRYIYIHHPHYSLAHNLLLKLSAPDVTEGGLQHDYLAAVCGIIAGNRWDGWLEEGHSTDLRVRIPALHHHVVPPGHYFFYLEPSTPYEPYPVCPSFRDWLFPHNNLPPNFWRNFSIPPRAVRRHLSASQASLSLERRDVSCRITASVEGTQKAHIIPVKEKAWYTDNGMLLYQQDSSRSMELDLANMLLLRADLHLDFDAGRFAMVPKSTTDNILPELVFHLVRASDEYEHLYHNLLETLGRAHVSFGDPQSMCY